MIAKVKVHNWESHLRLKIIQEEVLVSWPREVAPVSQKSDLMTIPFGSCGYLGACTHLLLVCR